MPSDAEGKRVVTEVAFISVHPGQEQDFLDALERARAVVSRAKGFRSLAAHRGVERPSTFMLVLGWETLEDHTEGFRGGPLFPEWRSHISPFFAAVPQVEHWV